MGEADPDAAWYLLPSAFASVVVPRWVSRATVPVCLVCLRPTCPLYGFMAGLVSGAVVEWAAGARLRRFFVCLLDWYKSVRAENNSNACAAPAHTHVAHAW
eukprot:4530326-Prymnesium_polylepis.1